MKKTNDLTVVVLTKNSQDYLNRYLPNLQFADEILVIEDSLAKGEIFEKLNARVIRRKLDNFASQKNFALDKVGTSWVFFLDDDEEVSPSLAKEIEEAVKSKDINGFLLPRRNMIFGRWVKGAGWYPDWQLRLFKKESGRFERLVHEKVKIEGKTANFKNDLIHQNYENLSHYFSESKFNLYTDLAAKSLLANGYHFFWLDLVRKPVDEFLRRFFAEKGYEEGILGLVLSLLQAFKELVIYAKVWERQKEEVAPEKLLVDLKKEFKSSTSKLGYWFNLVGLKLEKNWVRKIILRIKKVTNF